MKSLEYIQELKKIDTITEEIGNWLKLVDDFNMGNKTNLINSLFPLPSSFSISYFEIKIPTDILNKWNDELPPDGNIHAYFAINEKNISLYLIDEISDQQGNFSNILPNIELSNFSNGYPLRSFYESSLHIVSFMEANERICRWENEGGNWMENQQSIFKLMSIPVSDFTRNKHSDTSKASVTFYSYLALKIDNKENKFELITSNQAIHKESPAPIIPHDLMLDLTMPIPPFGNKQKSDYKLLIGSEQ
jgi:hypothetical protein